MRCPHCATAVAAPPFCHVCGSRLDVPAARQDTLEGLEPTSREGHDLEVDATPVAGLEPTRSQEPDVEVERMQGLMTNEEVLGDTTIPDDESSTGPLMVCPRCGAANDGGRFCARCGRTVAPAGRDRSPSPSPSPPPLICLECGVPNGREHTLCMSCGAAL